MAIPERLKIRPVSKPLLEEMLGLCDEIERELEVGETAEGLLQRWHSHTHRQYEPHEFRTYWKSMDKETFVLDALNPEPSFDENATYSEAIAVLNALSRIAIPESETRYYLGWLEEQFPDSNMNDLIFWPDQWFGDASLFRDASGGFKPESELTNDQILAYAMAKSGRRLTGSPSNVPLPFPMPGVR